MTCVGGVAEVWQQGDPRDPQPHGDEQPPHDRLPQRPQHLEAAHQGRAAQRQRPLHVPDQHGAHGQPDRDAGG